MTEIRTPVQPVKVEKACECENGRMHYNPKKVMAQPLTGSLGRPQAVYPHKCNICGREDLYPRMYPCTEFDPIVPPKAQ